MRFSKGHLCLGVSLSRLTEPQKREITKVKSNFNLIILTQSHDTIPVPLSHKLLNKQLSQAQVDRNPIRIMCETDIIIEVFIGLNLLSQHFTGLVKKLPLNYIPSNF